MVRGREMGFRTGSERIIRVDEIIWKIGLSLLTIWMLLIRVDFVQSAIIAEYQKEGIFLSWSEPDSRINGERLSPSEIAGFNIYRTLGGQDSGRRINLEIIKDVQYLDQDIEWGNYYGYTITTVDRHGLESPPSKLIEALPPLLPPNQVRATAKEKGVFLEWEKVYNPTLRGYIIYKTETPGQDYQKIASVLETDNHFQDQEVTVGKNYYYILTAVDISWQESKPSIEVGASPVFISQGDLSELEKMKVFRATIQQGAVILTWEPFYQDRIIGYNIYRRPDQGGQSPTLRKVNRVLIEETFYHDDQVEQDKIYYYCVAAVDKNGNEARFPTELLVKVSPLAIFSLTDDSEGLPRKGGTLLGFVLVGTPRQKASVMIEGEGIDEIILLQETDEEGVYYGQWTIPIELKDAKLSSSAQLENEEGQIATFTSDKTIAIDNLAQIGKIEGLQATSESGSVCLAWPSPSCQEEIAYLEIYRSSGECQVNGGELVSKIPPEQNSFCDLTIQPKQEYFYTLVAYDQAGNSAPLYQCYYTIALADLTAPKIYSVSEVSRPGVKRPGDKIIIHLQGEPQAKARLVIDRLVDELFQEVKPGLYVAEYTVGQDDEAVSAPVIITHTDASGNCSTWPGQLTVSISSNQATSPIPSIKEVYHNAFLLAGHSPLVAGDRVDFVVKGDPGCTAYLNLGADLNLSEEVPSAEVVWEADPWTDKIGGDISFYHLYSELQPFSSLKNLRPVATIASAQNHFSVSNYQGRYLAVVAERISGEKQVIFTPRLQIPLVEENPGYYKGTYQVKPGDYLSKAEVTAYLVNQLGMVSPTFTAQDQMTIDTSVKIAIAPQKVEDRQLRAGSISKAMIEFKVTDARGLGVSDRQIKVELFTTLDEYSGLLGLGYFEGKEYGHFDEYLEFITDPTGYLALPFIPGSAAKTVIIRAKDTLTDSVGLTYLTASLEKIFSFELLKLPEKKRFSNSEFILTVKVEKDWLTADGVSRSRIYAIVKNAQDKPVIGHLISFSLLSGSGKIEGAQGLTNSSGEVMATYIAGTQINPPAQIMIVDKTVSGLSQTKLITLKSDAPELINIYPEYCSYDLEPCQRQPIYADGQSSLDLIVRVTDQHENPNRGYPLQIELVEGDGRLIIFDKETNINGELRIKYLAGTQPGQVSLRVRAISRIPDEDILEKIRLAEDNF